MTVKIKIVQKPKCPHCKESLSYLRYTQVVTGDFDLESGRCTEDDYDYLDETHYYCPECEGELRLEELKLKK